jgi:hypothetical protein
LGYRFLADTHEHYPVETHWNDEPIGDGSFTEPTALGIRK